MTPSGLILSFLLLHRDPRCVLLPFPYCPRKENKKRPQQEKKEKKKEGKNNFKLILTFGKLSHFPSHPPFWSL